MTTVANDIAKAPDAAELIPIAVNLYRSGRLVEALATIDQALVDAPRHPGLLNNKGIFATRLGNPGMAETAYHHALEVQPDFAEAWNNLGNLLATQGRREEAEAAYREAIAARPAYANPLSSLGQLFLQSGRLTDAERVIDQALALVPDHVTALVNLSAVYLASHRHALAVTTCRRAITLDPGCVSAYSNLGLALMNLQSLAEAETAFREALRLDPSDQKARYNLAVLLLGQGRYAEGWHFYEARLDSILANPDFVFSKASPSGRAMPRWRGEPLAGRSLLVWPEGGFGDEVQFVRYLPLLQTHGLRRLTLACSAALKPWLRTQSLADEVIAIDEWTPDMASDCDFWSPLLSLPMHSGSALEQLPATLPYLAVPVDRLARWSPRIPPDGLRVGLIWKGSRGHPNDADRSLRGLATLAPLGSLPGIRFVSLQKGAGEGEAAAPPPGFPLLDLGAEIADFADTAAIVSLLDLLVSVDTAGAHVAAALGRPCWILLAARGTDWRWLHDRDDSPWYPGAVRLFRQDSAGDWEGVVSRLAAALHEWAQARIE